MLKFLYNFVLKRLDSYESFCSWVVQDETGRGMTIMDAKADPRCTHMRIKNGFEFYAGAPLITSYDFILQFLQFFFIKKY